MSKSMPDDVVWEVQDLTRLVWSERASSSGTAGTYLKSREGFGADMTYYKLSRFNGLEIDGHECVNELVASRLMGILGIEHLAYRLIHARVKIDSKEHITWLNSSPNFRKPEERKLAFGTFYDLYKQGDETPYQLCARFGWENRIKQMMLVDYLVANRDRHSSNIEVLVSPDGHWRLAPVFDTGLSLVAPYANNEELVQRFDPLRPVGTTNFIGSRSLEENLETVLPIPGIRSLYECDKDQLLAGLDEVLPGVYLEKIWDIIWKRWRRYEAIRAD